MINLALGRLEVDWGKNNAFTDHGSLFQSGDVKPVPTHYASDDWPNGEPIVEMNEGLAKPLGQVLDRLELLGHTLTVVEHHYSKLNQLHHGEEEPLPFAELRTALAEVDVNKISGNYGEDFSPGQFVRREILERLALNSYQYQYYGQNSRPDHWEVDLLLENFGANNALRLLAENPVNRNLDVSWDYSPLVESGWADKEEFWGGARTQEKFLIVTEGSSDAKIIRHAIQLLRPHVEDFFTFVDMDEGYPFSGTGNLFKFVQGLVSIGVQNQIVVVYDNDAEGTSKFQMSQGLSLPSNVKAIQLPHLESFSSFRTIGPTGESMADINGKAAEIECYLDLEQPGLPAPLVRWGPYNRNIDAYHGELLSKTQYARRFLSLRERNESYDFSKLETLTNSLIAACVSISEAELLVSM
jgi:hypothetical protein